MGPPVSPVLESSIIVAQLQNYKNQCISIIITGSYPCFCGLQDKGFGDAALFNTAGPLVSLEDRQSILFMTETWQKSATKGNIAPFDNMKVTANISPDLPHHVFYHFLDFPNIVLQFNQNAFVTLAKYILC